MDEQRMRAAAEAHAQAVLDGDMDHVTEDIHPDHREAVFAAAAAMPNPVTSAEVVDVRVDGEQGIADLHYGDEDSSMLLRSVWVEVDGRLQAISVSVVG